MVWAVTYRRIRGESFGIIPPLIDVYRDHAPQVCIAKAAQVFISEWCINLAFWCADSKAGRRGNALYVFPGKQDIGDFTRARVDTAVEESPYLRGRVRPLKGLQPIGRATNNVGLKRVGEGFVYFRGSNAESGLLSIDADLVLYDEVDRLKEGTLALGAKRLGSSLLGWQRFASTPLYPETGIDALWLQSDRRRYHLRCEHCGERQALSFPGNVTEDGTVICCACHDSLNRLAAGEWVAEQPGAERHGYHVTKLLSPRADLKALATLGYRIQRRDETDQHTIQQFYNQDLGVPHAPEGGQLSRAEIEACCADYSLGDWAPTGCTMGVDVGAKLHVVIGAPSPEGNGKTRIAYINALHDWADIDRLMPRFDVSSCVVDAEPEHHKAREFANRWAGRVWLCHYPNTAQWSHQEPVAWNGNEHAVSAHRTITLDGMFAELRERRVELPREVLALPEFAEQMMAPIRVIEKDTRGNPVARYVEGGKADHYCHGANYERIARLRPDRIVSIW